MKLTTDIHKALGLGSAKSGLHHWIAQRVTAIALIPLSLWFATVFIMLITAPYEKAHFSLSSPLAATLSIFFIIFMFYHGYLGMRVIFEDYIAKPFLKWAAILGTKLFSTFMAILATVSLLKIFLS